MTGILATTYPTWQLSCLQRLNANFQHIVGYLIRNFIHPRQTLLLLPSGICTLKLGSAVADEGDKDPTHLRLLMPSTSEAIQAPIADAVVTKSRHIIIVLWRVPLSVELSGT